MKGFLVPRPLAYDLKKKTNIASLRRIGLRKVLWITFNPYSVFPRIGLSEFKTSQGLHFISILTEKPEKNIFKIFLFAHSHRCYDCSNPKKNN